MKTASDFRRIARDSLRGRWGIAVLAGFLAVLVGAVSAGSGPKIDFQFGSESGISFSFAGQELSGSLGGLLADLAGFVLVLTLALSLVYLVIGSVVSIGYARFNLNLVDRQWEVRIGTLFSYFRYWTTAVASQLLQALYVALWSLLLIIPGIMAGYSYAMTNYILAEHPDMTASQAISISKQMMYGHRFRLFCLELSFLGWSVLAALTLGIGNLWLIPYQQAARAAFFRKISGTEVAPNVMYRPYV